MRRKPQPVPDSALQDWIDRLVKADRLLCSQEIQAVYNPANNQKPIEKAFKAISDGDEAVTNQRYSAAIIHYRDGWQGLVNSLKR